MSLLIYSKVCYIGPVNVQENINLGDIGYIVEDYGDGNYEVEFSGPDGITKALAVIAGTNLESVD